MGVSRGFDANLSYWKTHEHFDTFYNQLNGSILLLEQFV